MVQLFRRRADSLGVVGGFERGRERVGEVVTLP
jgi:hypothetical protein